ncbi:YpbF family protein [Neobacillus mesonae]|uniref:YpbF family protein n=1 Tax=Neobacillus mesonae TaxID=1193713 RepID=UPI00203A6FE9|nr:YpbF family protein [Neobacillus mesonae]MCM3566759.1 YpbF family protein [Neobacillus mesonae]
MDTPIQLLDHTDPATKQMLENLRKRKAKFDIAEKRHFYSIYGTLGFAFLFCCYFYFNIAEHNSYSFFAMFSAALKDGLNLILFSITLISYGAMNVFRKQKDKKEKEYQELRCEIVDRSKDLWKKEEEWKNRHLIFEVMKKHYDINLYHEKK